MISLPQIQFACDLCPKRVEVEIEFAYVTSSYDEGRTQEFSFDVSEWMQENGWRRLDEDSIACPKHREGGQP